MKRLTPVALLLAASACATGPFDRPYSVVQVDPVRAADPHVIKVLINRIDGENAVQLDRMAVTPGRHLVTVDVPPRKGFHLATQNTFELVTEPCTRYYIAGRLNTLVTQEWVPMVRSNERIPECEAKFK